MECPRCRLVSPEDAQTCDCGYDFVSRIARPRPKPAPRPRLVPRWLVWSGAAGCLLVLAFCGFASWRISQFRGRRQRQAESAHDAITRGMTSSPW